MKIRESGKYLLLSFGLQNIPDKFDILDEQTLNHNDPDEETFLKNSIGFFFILKNKNVINCVHGVKFNVDLVPASGECTLMSSGKYGKHVIVILTSGTRPTPLRRYNFH